jgi:hypothetical protein
MERLTKQQIGAGIIGIVVIIVVLLIVIFKKESYTETNKDANKYEIREDFPQTTPMNMLYSDASGNLSSSTELVLSAIKLGNLTLTEAPANEGGGLRITTPSGWVDIGAKNDGWCHIYTDRPKFAFSKPLTDVAGSPYKDYAKYNNQDTTNITVGTLSSGTISSSGAISASGNISTSSGNISATGTISTNGNISTSGEVSSSTNKIGNVTLSEAPKSDSGGLRITTSSGWLDIGAKNPGWAHIYTDRPKFAFSKPLTDVATSTYKDYAKYTGQDTTNIALGDISASSLKSSGNVRGSSVTFGDYSWYDEGDYACLRSAYANSTGDRRLAYNRGKNYNID